MPTSILGIRRIEWLMRLVRIDGSIRVSSSPWFVVASAEEVCTRAGNSRGCNGNGNGNSSLITHSSHTIAHSSDVGPHGQPPGLNEWEPVSLPFEQAGRRLIDCRQEPQLSGVSDGRHASCWVVQTPLFQRFRCTASSSPSSPQGDYLDGLTEGDAEMQYVYSGPQLTLQGNPLRPLRREEDSEQHG